MPDSAPLSSAKLMPKVEELRVTTGPFPASRKVHVPGRLHRGISVAMREIDLEASSGEPAVRAYDTSGLYSDPAAEIDIQKGLPELRKPWIVARGDVEFYQGREVKPEDNGLRSGEASAVSLFDRNRRQVLRAKGDAAVTQIAYARRGIVTPEMEYVAIRENLGREKLLRQGAVDGESFGASIPDYVTPGIRPRRDRSRPGHHPEQHQPSGNRADDHRPQFPGEGQRQYRQLDRHLLGRRGGREDGVGDALGRRHGHGSVDRAQHPHDPRMDHPQLAGADRHRADLSGARKGRRQGRGADLGIVPRHLDRAGRAGGRLLHDPCRRAARLHSADRFARHRHRLARRLDHGEVVPGAPSGEFPLHAFPRNQRDHAGL